MLLLPHLQVQPRPAVINVTSGLALSPLAGVPVYSATKVAMHSFSQSLRRQLGQTTVGQTPVAVIEVLPPAVDTDLGWPGQHTCGVPLDQFADEAMGRLASGELEIVFRT